MKTTIKYLLPVLLGLGLLNSSLATALPVGPITFSANTDYDHNFKEPAAFSGIVRSPSGYLQLIGSPTGVAAFDVSATGGMNGLGGTSGVDANNDLSDFTISADVASSVPIGIGAGFLLRLNSSEAAGYVAAVHSLGATTVRFDIGEGAGFAGAGIPIFTTVVPLSGLTLTADTFYNFSVTISGGTFSLDFANGAATAAYTDPTVSATSGQVGIVLDTISPTATTRLDNFTIVPEPNVFHLLLPGMTTFILLRWPRSKHAMRRCTSARHAGCCPPADASGAGGPSSGSC